MKRALLLALVLALPARSEPAIVWAKNIEEAKKQSGEKKPIAVVLVQKGCPLSADLMKTLSADGRVLSLAPSLAWLLVQVGTEEYKDWFLKTCGGNVEGTPSLVFLNPKGENADPEYAGLATVTSADPDALCPAIREVLQRAKQEEPPKDKDAVKAAMEKSRGAKTPSEAIAALREAIRAGDGWRGEAAAVEEARGGIEKRLQEGSAEMLRILREVHDVEEQKKAFDAVRTNYAGTAIADWATDESIRVKSVKK